MSTNFPLYRYYIKGSLELTTPMIIASGEDEVADLQCIRDHENKLIIPGTSLAGVIRSYLQQKLTKQNRLLLEDYFGSDDQNSGHSLFVFHDAVANGDATDIRDGVALDNLTKTAKPQAKYDFETVREGTSFHFRMEMLIRENNSNEKNKLEGMLHEIIRAFENGEVSLGAKTNRGLGRCKLRDPKVCRIALRDDVDAWINFEWENFDQNHLIQVADLATQENPNLFDSGSRLTITANFRIPDSLLIRSYSKDPKDVDMVMFESAGKPTIPGTSWNGAIRHALENAGREMGCFDTMKKLLDDAFGFVNENSQAARASRIIIHESEIQEGQAIPYVRNKVDRFTGGVVDGALFDEKPVYGGSVEFKCELKDDEKWIRGLIYLALLEMGNGIQPVGGASGIGRGRLDFESESFSPNDKQDCLNALAQKLNEKQQQIQREDSR